MSCKDVAEAATSFIPKPITSIERTRKLSILLKHQRHTVSCKNNCCGLKRVILSIRVITHIMAPFQNNLYQAVTNESHLTD